MLPSMFRSRPAKPDAPKPPSCGEIKGSPVHTGFDGDQVIFSLREKSEQFCIDRRLITYLRREKKETKLVGDHFGFTIYDETEEYAIETFNKIRRWWGKREV